MAACSEHPTRERTRLAGTLPTTLLSAVLAVGATAGLGGCGGGDPAPAGDSAPTTSSAASPSATGSSVAVGGRLEGKGYTLALPTGWQEATDQFKEYSPLVDAGALNATQAGQAFSDNVNVLRNADQTELPVATAERQFADELGTVASRVRVEDPTTIDGVPAVHLSGRTRAGEVVALTDQFIAFVDDAYYVVTFSYSTGTPDAQRADEVAAMLASWAWE